MHTKKGIVNAQDQTLKLSEKDLENPQNESRIIDAKGGSKQCYEKYGFTSFQDIQNKLFITTAALKATL